MTNNAPICVLPACANRVSEWGQACAPCLELFGDYLAQDPHGQLLSRQQIEDRDDRVSTVLVERRAMDAGPALAVVATRTVSVPQGERKRNQRCWLCEERRVCTMTAQGWECDTCRCVEPSASARPTPLPFVLAARPTRRRYPWG